MSILLSTVHASAPSSEIKLHTLELIHESFPNGAYRWVQGFQDEVFTLEDGQSYTFEGMGFGVSLPERSLRGNQDIQFQIDNVTGEALRAISGVINAGTKMQVIYRAFLDSNHSAPAQPATRMTATGMTADYKSVSVIADFHDFVNMKWPKKRYTSTVAPGLSN